MKKIVLLSIMLSYFTLGFSQKSIKIYIGYSSSYHPIFDYDPLFGIYSNYLHNEIPSFMGNNLEAGIRISQNKGEFDVFLNYQLFANLKNKIINGFEFASNLIGIGGHYIINRKKKFSPFVGVLFLTEMQSNYRNNFVYTDGFPSKTRVSYTLAPDIYFYDYNYPDYPTYGMISCYAIYYYSTRFTWMLEVGYTYRINQNLNLRLSLFSNCRYIKYRYLKEKPDLKVHSLNFYLKNQRKVTRAKNVIGLRLGFSYTFPFHKKTKNE